jgi:hypothetical protein
MHNCNVFCSIMWRLVLIRRVNCIFLLQRLYFIYSLRTDGDYHKGWNTELRQKISDWRNILTWPTIHLKALEHFLSSL